MMKHWRSGLLSICLSLMLVVTGCNAQPPSPYTQVQQESTQRNAPAAVAKEAVPGSQFNALFPQPRDGFERVYTQEKKGFSEAKLKKDGKDLAMLSISDTISLPMAAQKYSESTATLAGYPMLEIGNTQTGLLVADRFQVKALSRDASFTPENRKEWLTRFDLTGLAKLK
ncbi:hypothetical protein GS597_11590 [Synechococcales cyanobacterium C]|uniref:Uncharacterized protein n=1 Tax=Petrachloros mirabilis ULC683 TaxID=2781853 RepID=A0A8K1ZZV0_9CYAN|nr:hypothetical protein [Petrachloros mirabilis]NCJ07138.1 hypothetical protein [Petrachloros mirabilis ULC683]